MARVPLISEDHGPLSALIAKLKGARGGKLINLPGAQARLHEFRDLVENPLGDGTGTAHHGDFFLGLDRNHGGASHPRTGP